jgi:hypothetical protein
MPSRTLLLAVFILLAGAFGGCTERMPLDPVQTDDSNWAPEISIYKNDYQRVELNVCRPPRKELLRNILFYTAHFRKPGSTQDQAVDTLNGKAIEATYVYMGPRPYDHLYRSPAVLDYGSDYAVRFVVHYGTGITRNQGELQFTTPPARGRIIRQLPIPGRYSTEYNEPYIRIAFHRGDLIVRRDEGLFKVDTASGQATLLKQGFHPATDRAYQQFQPLFVIGDTVLTYSLDNSSRRLTLMSLDLNTLQVDTSIKITAPGYFLACTIGPESNLYALCINQTGNPIIVVYRRTGQLVQTPSVVPPLFALDPSSGASLIFDGRWFCYSSWGEFDNRIARYDPSTFAIAEQHHNPVFAPFDLAWDGANFWTVDTETWTIVKLELSGL